MVKFGGQRKGKAPQQAATEVPEEDKEEERNMLDADTSSAGMQELLARRAQDSRDSRRVHAEGRGMNGFFRGPNEESAIKSMTEKLQKLSAGIGG